MTLGAQELIALLELLQHAPRVVDGAVVDHDDFVADLRRLRERLRRELHEQREILGLVLRGDEDRDIDPAIERVGELRDGPRAGVRHHTRLRMRAERTPSWSRYLATVRRAIWTPV